MSYERYLIADTHLGHAKAAEWRGFSSIKEHDEAMIEAWNSVVNPKDTVWHLGDAVFPRTALPLLRRLNGHKHLVMGNHDRHHIQEYIKYFNKIVGVAKIKGLVLSHVPIHPNELCYRWEFNVHGHLHHPERLLGIQNGYYCVCADIIPHFKPVSFDYVITAKEKYHGDH